ncbi:MAG: glycosyltransferase family 1 protein [Chloroflexi bacterium]|nr:MAG: glycosyltransferase family 1 protein [Chloroflexota bacterium]MBL1194127.1 glycosyltransferase family 1 protein [Chloroflexota bacterium]NOH11420.1 glycosyltransferase [Chloroflexota bacterium]
MRIAMLSYHTCPLATLGGKDTGGMNVYVRELTRELGRQGIHVDVFTRSQDEHVPHVVHDLGYGNRVVHVPAGPEEPLPKEEMASYIPEFVEGVLFFSSAKHLQYDLIHSHYWMSGIAAKELKAIWDVPVVHMFHTLGLMKNRIAGEGEYEGDYRIRGELEVLRIADKVVAATPAETAQLQWLYEVKTDHVTIVPPGVDICHFYPIPKDEAKEYIGVSPDDQLLMYVGRIEPLKGIDTLLQAIANMRAMEGGNDRNISLAIIGGEADISEEQMTTEMGRLQRMCDKLGLKDIVSFMGKRSQDKLPYYYSAAEVVVVPSLYESFGMVALEAMACGTPVIASQVGGLVFLIQDGVNGFHFPDRDADALCLSLRNLLDDDEQRAMMGGQAAEYAKQFSWENIADQIRLVYGELLDKEELTIKTRLKANSQK